MASSPTMVAYIQDQLSESGDIVIKKMFGEYGVYCDEIFMGVICQDTLFIKPTTEGLAFYPEAEQRPAYEGAKPSIVVSAERLEDVDWLTQFMGITKATLPVKKKRKKS